MKKVEGIHTIAVVELAGCALTPTGFSTDWEESTDDHPYLLVGIVRIFSKKVEFLEDDCNKTLKTLTESVEAIYWKNPKKSKHVQKQTSHLAETSDGGTHSGMGLLKALRARSGQVVISVPATFELDLFDLEIADDWYGAFSCTV